MFTFCKYPAYKLCPFFLWGCLFLTALQGFLHSQDSVLLLLEWVGNIWFESSFHFVYVSFKGAEVLNVDVGKSFSFMFYHFYSLDKYFLTLGSHPPRFKWLFKIVERKCLVWERCFSGGSASWLQASPSVRCRSCSEQQGSMSPCATMLPLLGSTSSGCKTTSYFGFLFLRTARPKAFFFDSKCGGQSGILENPFTVLWPSSGRHLWPLSPEAKMSACSRNSPGL